MAFHHFASDGLRRGERIQRWVVRQLMETKVPNNMRESSVEWELKHSAGVMRIARILAEKRGVDAELAETAACLHDIFVIVNGGYGSHAKKGVEMARKALEEGKDFEREEIAQILDAVASHSDKQIYTGRPLAELIKDADTLDCFFYGDDIYSEKPDDLKLHYFKRLILVRRELGLPDKKAHLEEFARLGGRL